MAGYQPTLEDAQGFSAAQNDSAPGYVPALEDVGYQPTPDDAWQGSTGITQNPSQMNPYERLSSLHQFTPDPAMVMAMTAPEFLPEMSVGSGMFGSIANPILNSLARVGAGTGASLAAQAPQINSMQALQNNGSNDLQMNALLEGSSIPFRMAGSIAELFNPVEYTGNKIAQIQNQYSAAKDAQQQAYAPVFEKYGSTPVTSDPESYLGFTDNQISRFTPDINKSYNDFLNSPTFQNLHNLQSQMGKDGARLSNNTNKINTAQTINNARDTVQDKAQEFLAPDQPMQDQYNQGTAITRDVVSPFEATNTLKKVSNGTINSLAPGQLVNEISKGTEKSTGAIPADHPLMNHLNDMNTRLQMASAAKTILPGVTGAVAGDILHPGLGGFAGGALSGLGSSQLSAMASKFGAPSMTDFIQNPLIRNVFGNYLKPALYMGGRGTINYLNQNQ